MIRIRKDLQAIPIHSEDGVLYYDVLDPSTKTVFRLYDIEWELAEQLQQEHSLTSLQTWIQKRFGYVPTHVDLDVFFQHLRSFGWEINETPLAKSIPFQQSKENTREKGEILSSITVSSRDSSLLQKIAPSDPASEKISVSTQSGDQPSLQRATEKRYQEKDEEEKIKTRENIVSNNLSLSSTQNLPPLTEETFKSQVTLGVQQPSSHSTKEPEESKKSKLWAASALLVVLVIGILFLLFLLFGLKRP